MTPTPRPDRERLIDALVPAPLPGRARPRPAPLPALPAPRLPIDTSPADLLLGLARPDRSGRITERRLLRALRWSSGHRVDIHVHDETLLIAPAAAGRHAVGSRGGRHAGEHLIAAARALYNRAIADGLIDAAASPAHRVSKPRRLPNTRRALTPHELDQINLVARTSGNDVTLDALLLRLHTETACRRGGAVASIVAGFGAAFCGIVAAEAIWP